MSELALRIVVECLRKLMIEMAEEKGVLVDPSVIEISQTLDEYIVKLQQTKRKQHMCLNQAV